MWGEKDRWREDCTTVDGTDIPMGVFSLFARSSQAQTVAMYKSFMGSADNIWSQVVDKESGETAGEQAKVSSWSRLS